MSTAIKLNESIALLDVDKIQSIRQLSEPGDKEDFFTSLAMIFFDRAPTLLLKIKSAVDKSEARELETSAHALKGSCGNLGANHMAELCRQLEENGRNKSTTGNAEILEELNEVYTLTKAELENVWLK